jgi:glyoxylase-like metal-dependent hydrolase (beta-lactamase superfamily II)
VKTVVEIERYPGNEASVNSYLISDARNLIVVDLLRNSREAEALADHVESTGKKLDLIFVSHGHPDHYIGLGVFHSRFPDVPIKVASSNVRDDIVHFSTYMESIGWLNAEPKMKVKSAQNPDGFDYSNVIGVLNEPLLRLPPEQSSIQVQTDYPAAECSHTTTLVIPTQRAFLGFDLLYNHVHAWCGSGVGRAEIENWLNALDGIARVASEGGWTFYCGHGDSGDERLVSNMKRYLQTFLQVTTAAKSRQEAMDEMKALFPGFAQEDFLLRYSVEFHVKETN